MTAATQQTTELIVVRHGQTEWNVRGRVQGSHDSPLTERGVRQAKAVGEALAFEAIDAVYSSDLGRAQQTAEIIAAHVGCEMRLEPALRERRFGVFEGLTWAEIAERHPDDFAAYEANRDHAPPGGETSSERHERVVSCVERLVAAHRGQRILVVSHGGTLKCLFKHTVGLPHEEPRRFSVFNAALNRFSITDGEWKLEVWGDTHHLRSLS
jgi:probable phosphoglycerate mutase